MIQLEPGTLWERTVARSEEALACGARLPLASVRVAIKDGGIAFDVRVLTDRVRKPPRGTSGNPFLPYDESVFVADVSSSHVCLLNKFNVLDHHLLIVTRDFEPQDSALTADDFEALAACMAEFDAFAFYNSGAVAGSSQSHKHLQVVPVPLGAGPARTPIDAVMAATRFEGACEPGVGRAPLPFANAVAKPGALDGPGLEATYAALRRAMGLSSGRPFNLLVTCDWMMLVPRAHADLDGIPVNALGFAGALLAKNRDQLEIVRRRGPLAVLRHVAP